MCLVRGAGKEQARHFKHKTVNTDPHPPGRRPPLDSSFEALSLRTKGENLHEPHARDCSRKQPVH